MLGLTVQVKKHERGLRFVDGEFERVLTPGRYTRWRKLFGRDASIVVLSTLTTYVAHPLLDTFVDRPELAAHAETLKLGDTQRALVWRDGRLAWILGPGRYAFWRQPYTLGIETFDSAQFRFTHPRLATALAHPEAVKFLEGVQVPAYETVLLLRDGVLVEQLGAGLHVFWKGTGKLAFKSVELREQTADVAGQEIMTQDKLSLRVNLVATYQVADAVRAATSVTDYQQTLYREAQLALRAAVGARTLDALLADKEAVGEEVRQMLAKRAGEIGVKVLSIGLRDLILPGDMRELLNQVLAAQKEAEANLIRRREETAAARSQANTAKLLAENPQLARLKELEMLQQILADSKATFVFGNAGVLEQVKGLVKTAE